MTDISVGLPKWPAMFVRGTSISKEQAKEVIRRTDSFFADLWNLTYQNSEVKKLAMQFGFVEPPNNDYATMIASREAYGNWLEKWEYIQLDYIRNDWINSFYINGPHGWCRPNGNIDSVYNVGKWPSIESILSEWAAIAEAFPFLDLRATLCDKEYTEEGIQSLVDIVVNDGCVRLAPPTHRTLLPECSFDAETIRGVFSGSINRCGVKFDWLDSWAEKSRSILTELKG